MKALITAIALTIFPLPSSAFEGIDRYGDYGYMLIKSGSKVCNINELILTTKSSYQDETITYCVAPKSFIRTENGGRVQVISSESHESKLSHGSYAEEINCRAMERRSIPELWSFSNIRDEKQYPFRWKPVGNAGWWRGKAIARDRSWGPWKVMNSADEGMAKYICNRWKAGP